MRPSLTLIFCVSLLCFASSRAFALQTGQMPKGIPAMPEHYPPDTGGIVNRNHCMAQVQQPQGYPCPFCGYLISAENVSANIRMENKCPNCGKVFFGKPVTVAKKEKTANYQRGYAPYGPYGPRNYGPTSVYQSDVSYQRFGVGGYSFKETPTGFSELSWSFHDRKTKSYRVVPRWRTTRYHYP